MTKISDEEVDEHKKETKEKRRELAEQELEREAKRNLRQLSDEEIDNRTKWHPPTDEDTASLHNEVRKTINNSIKQINMFVPESREKSLAITKLEEAMMWANAGIARNQ